MYTPLNNMNMK